MLLNLAFNTLKQGIQHGFDNAKMSKQAAIAWREYKKQSALDYDYWKKKTDYSNQLGLEQWNRENEYNNASSQVQRLKDANLAPELMYASGNSSGISADFSPIGASSGSGASYSMPSGGVGAMTDTTTALGLQQMKANVDKTQAETESIENNNSIFGIVKANQEAILAVNRSLKSVQDSITKLNNANARKADSEKDLTDVNKRIADIEEFFRGLDKRCAESEVYTYFADKDGKVHYGGMRPSWQAIHIYNTSMNMLNLISKSKDNARVTQLINNLGLAFQNASKELRYLYGDEGVRTIEQKLRVKLYQALTKNRKYQQVINKYKYAFGGADESIFDMEMDVRYKRGHNQMTDTFNGSTTEWFGTAFGGLKSGLGAAADVILPFLIP